MPDMSLEIPINWDLLFNKMPKSSFEVRRHSDPDPNTEPISPITSTGPDAAFTCQPIADYPHPLSQATVPSITELRPHFDTPPYFLHKKRWYLIICFRIAVLFLNSFIQQFDISVLKYFELEITKDLGLRKGQLEQLSSY